MAIDARREFPRAGKLVKADSSLKSMMPTRSKLSEWIRRGQLRSTRSRKFAVNGRKSLRCRAAAVGLALLMGSSFLGCHAGPRFFAKKDRDERASKKEFAERGKFINKKKVRPESDYFKDGDATEERVAKNDSKSKAKPKSTDSDRFRNSEEIERSVASRQRNDEANGDIALPKKATNNKQAANKDASKSVATKRPESKEIEDSLFDDPLPDKKTIVRPTVKPSVASKNKEANEDPFKNTVVRNFDAKRSAEKVATVNFDNLEDDDDDEIDEDDEIEAPVRSVKNTVDAAKKSAGQRTADASSNLKRKFLPEDDVDEMTSAVTTARRKTEQAHERQSRATEQVSRKANSVSREADSTVANNKRQAQQTLSDWRRELDQSESADGETETIPGPSLKSTASSSDRSARTQNSGHISQTTLDEFAPNKKSQGAVLNGDLIIDTSTAPTRFQRSDSSRPGTNSGRNESDSSNRTRPNSAATIDIVPGATQNRARPEGQIILQSLSDHDAAGSKVEPAVYEQTTSEASSEGGLSLLISPADDDQSTSESQTSSASSGPRLVPLDSDITSMPAVNQAQSDASSWKSDEQQKSVIGKGTLLLAIGGIVTAALIGLGIRRRKEELVPVPVRVPTPEPMRVDSPYDPTTWPRG